MSTITPMHAPSSTPPRRWRDWLSGRPAQATAAPVYRSPRQAHIDDTVDTASRELEGVLQIGVTAMLTNKVGTRVAVRTIQSDPASHDAVATFKEVMDMQMMAIQQRRGRELQL